MIANGSDSLAVPLMSGFSSEIGGNGHNFIAVTVYERDRTSKEHTHIHRVHIVLGSNQIALFFFKCHLCTWPFAIGFALFCSSVNQSLLHEYRCYASLDFCYFS